MAETGPVDVETLERLASSCGGGARGWAFVRELIDTLLEEAPAQLAMLRNAVEHSDAETARRIAHTLKTHAATFGAPAFGAVCLELEEAAKRSELDGAATTLVARAELEWERVREALQGVGPEGAR